MVAYATVEDVYLQGLPRGSAGQGARWIASVDTSTNRLEVGNHGFGANTPVQFQTKGDAVLPAPLVPHVVYFVRLVAGSDSFFEVSLTEDGAAIDLTTEGSGAFAVYTSVTRSIEALLETYSRWFDGKLVGHHVPLTPPYPAVATHVVAVRTAAHVARILGLGKDGERLYEAEALLLSDIPALARGVPLRDANATASANSAVFAAWGNSTRRKKIP